MDIISDLIVQQRFKEFALLRAVSYRIVHHHIQERAGAPGACQGVPGGRRKHGAHAGSGENRQGALGASRN